MFFAAFGGKIDLVLALAITIAFRLAAHIDAFGTADTGFIIFAGDILRR